MPKTDYVRETHHEFLEASADALSNPGLQLILGQLGDSLGKKNREAWEQLPHSDLVRERARTIKDETLAELDTHLETLEKSVLARGGKVYFADDGEEACRQVIDIIQAKGAKKVTNPSR